jgi:hypothetical protein
MGRTKSKLRLNPINPSERFNTRFFNEVKHLSTFVDAKNKLQRLNIFNDVAMLRKLNYLKQHQKYTLTEEEKVLD